MLSFNDNNNINGTLFNNATQPLNTSYTLIQPVISGRQVTFETLEECTVWHYNELIIAIIKVIDIQYVMHCVDNQYQLIIIYRAGDMLIHIIPSKTLWKHLNK